MSQKTALIQTGLTSFAEELQQLIKQENFVIVEERTRESICDQDEETIRTLRSIALRELNRPQEAFALWDQYRLEDMHNPQALKEWARAAHASCAYDLALNIWRSLEHEMRHDRVVLRGKAAALRALGHDSEAARILKRITRRHPTDIHSLVERAYVELEQGNIRKAIFLFRQVRFLKPSHVQATAGLIMALIHKGQLLRAKLLLLEARKFPCQSFRDWKTIGHAAMAVGDYETGVFAWHTAYTQNPQDVRVLRGYVNALVHAGKKEEASLIFSKIDPESFDQSFEDRLFFAKMLIEIGRPEEAENLLKSEEANQNNLDVLGLLAIIYLERGDHAAAENALRKAFLNGIRGRSRSKVGVRLSILLYQMGRYEEAARIALQVVQQKNYPDNFVKRLIHILARGRVFEEARQLCRHPSIHFVDQRLFLAYMHFLENHRDAAFASLNAIFRKHDLGKITFHESGLSGWSLSSSPERFSFLKRRRAARLRRPKVSCILTCFNNADLLERSLYSVLTQTYTDIEVIVVDDCSEDDSFLKAKNLAENDNRISLLKTEKNSGPYFAKNLAIQEAKGEFLFFQDADDISLPQRFDRQLPPLLEKTKEKPFATMCYHLRVDEFDGSIVPRAFEFFTPSPISLCFCREKFLSIFGAFDTVRAGADSELIKRIQSYLGKEAIQLIPLPLYLASFRPGTLTSSDQFRIDELDTASCRKVYKEASKQWHGAINTGQASPFLHFPEKSRPFEAPEAIRVL